MYVKTVQEVHTNVPNSKGKRENEDDVASTMEDNVRKRTTITKYIAINTKKGKVQRIQFSSQQLAELENKFAKKSFLSKDETHTLADQLELTYTRVQIWFQNRRYVFILNRKFVTNLISFNFIL